MVNRDHKRCQCRCGMRDACYRNPPQLLPRGAYISRTHNYSAPTHAYYLELFQLHLWSYFRTRNTCTIIASLSINHSASIVLSPDYTPPEATHSDIQHLSFAIAHNMCSPVLRKPIPKGGHARDSF